MRFGSNFEAHGKLLSKKKPGGNRCVVVPIVVPIELGSTWQIVDAGKSYMVWRVRADRLTVYFDALQSLSASRQPRQRIDQTRSQTDGIFTFVDLPKGRISCASAPPRWVALRRRWRRIPPIPFRFSRHPTLGNRSQVAQVDVDCRPRDSSAR